MFLRFQKKKKSMYISKVERFHIFLCLGPLVKHDSFKAKLNLVS